jgi:gentisate 1,2-dioxygenase
MILRDTNYTKTPFVTLAMASSMIDTPPQSADSAAQLLQDLEDSKTLPLWTQMTRLNPPEPNPTAIPFVWKYDSIRPNLLRAGHLVTEKQAERRVLMLVNPARGMPF